MHFMQIDMHLMYIDMQSLVYMNLVYQLLNVQVHYWWL